MEPATGSAMDIDEHVRSSKTFAEVKHETIDRSLMVFPEQNYLRDQRY